MESKKRVKNSRFGHVEKKKLWPAEPAFTCFRDKYKQSFQIVLEINWRPSGSLNPKNSAP